jgi:hypothetical protein
MGGIIEFWRHVETGEIYAIESTPFGQVLGAAGPLDAEALPEAADCQCTPKINLWINRAIANSKLRRISVKTLHPANR